MFWWEYFVGDAVSFILFTAGTHICGCPTESKAKLDLYHYKVVFFPNTNKLICEVILVLLFIATMCGNLPSIGQLKGI